MPLVKQCQLSAKTSFCVRFVRSKESFPSRITSQQVLTWVVWTSNVKVRWAKHIANSPTTIFSPYFLRLQVISTWKLSSAPWVNRLLLRRSEHYMKCRQNSELITLHSTQCQPRFGGQRWHAMSLTAVRSAWEHEYRNPLKTEKLTIRYFGNTRTTSAL